MIEILLYLKDPKLWEFCYGLLWVLQDLFYIISRMMIEHQRWEAGSEQGSRSGFDHVGNSEPVVLEQVPPVNREIDTFLT